MEHPKLTTQLGLNIKTEHKIAFAKICADYNVTPSQAIRTFVRCVIEEGLSEEMLRKIESDRIRCIENVFVDIQKYDTLRNELQRRIEMGSGEIMPSINIDIQIRRGKPISEMRVRNLCEKFHCARKDLVRE